uniref:Uncharacterized protein n=1 Tax=Trichuris muris TaxID=70415 RepID=A0A5S6QXN8_TRIMR
MQSFVDFKCHAVWERRNGSAGQWNKSPSTPANLQYRAEPVSVCRLRGDKSKMIAFLINSACKRLVSVRPPYCSRPPWLCR